MRKLIFIAICAIVLCSVCGCIKQDERIMEETQKSKTFIMKTPEMKVGITPVDTRNSDTDESFIYTVKEFENDGIINNVNISYKVDVNYTSDGGMTINSFSDDGVLLFGMKVGSDGKIIEDNFYDITKADGCVNRKYQNLKMKLNNDFGIWWDLACAFGACGYISAYVSAAVLCASGSTKYDQ